MTNFDAIQKKPMRWRVLAGLVLCYATTNGILIFGLPTLNPFLMQEFDWTPGQVTLPATVFFLVGAITSPPAGYLLDRFNTRAIIGIGLLGIAAGLYALSHATTIGQIAAIYGLLAASLSLSGLVGNMVLITRWFGRDRGLATGILLLSASIAGGFTPALIATTATELTWQTAMHRFAIATFAISAVIFMLLSNGTPSSDVSARKNSNAGLAPLWRALHEPRFYGLAVATGAVWFVVVALLQHQPIYLTSDLNNDPKSLGTVLGVFFLAAALGKLASGWAADYRDPTIVLSGAIVFLLLGIGILLQLEAPLGGLGFAYAVLGGIGFASAFTVIQVLIASNYAGPGYGTILAVFVFIDTIAGALGNRAVGVLRDTTGTYAAGFTLMIIVLLGALLALWTVARIETKRSSAT